MCKNEDRSRIFTQVKIGFFRESWWGERQKSCSCHKKDIKTQKRLYATNPSGWFCTPNPYRTLFVFCRNRLWAKMGDHPPNLKKFKPSLHFPIHTFILNRNRTSESPKQLWKSHPLDLQNLDYFFPCVLCISSKHHLWKKCFWQLASKYHHTYKSDKCKKADYLLDNETSLANSAVQHRQMWFP